MAKVEQINLHFTANAKAAKKAIAEVKNMTAETVAKMDALARAGKQNSKEYKELNDRFKLLNSLMTENIKDIDRINNAVNNLSKTSLKDLKSALAAAKREMGKLTGDAKDREALKQRQNDIRKLQEQIDKLEGSTKKASTTFGNLVKHGAQMIAMYASFNQVVSMIKTVVDGNLKLSDSLADIRKVSGLTIDDINDLSRSLAKIDTRVPQEELNKLAYAGAKLGLGEYGTSGLLQFTKAATQLQAALGEDMGGDALIQLSKMAQVMGDMKNMGVEQSLMAIGSSVFKLSTTTTSTGSNIMQFAQRLTGLGKTANMTSAEILALGSAADSMALMPEVAATAFNKFISTLQSKYGQIGKAVGIPPETLKSLLEAGKTMDAIVMILERMHSMGNLNSLVPIMGDLGGDGARLAMALSAMAANVSMVEDQLETSNKAFEEATAITAEYNIQNETAAALMERASNMWEKGFVNPDSIDVIKELAKAWYDATKALTENVGVMTAAKIAIQGLVTALSVAAQLLPAFVTYMASFAVLKGLPMLFTAIGTALGYFGASVHVLKLRMQGLVSNLMGYNAECLQTIAFHQQLAVSSYNAALGHKRFAESIYASAASEEELLSAEAMLLEAEEALNVARAELVTTTGELAAATSENTASLLTEVEAEEAETIATEAQVVAESKATQEKLVAAGVTTKLKAEEEKRTSILSGLGNKQLWITGIIAAMVYSLYQFTQEMNKANESTENAKRVTDRLAEAKANANAEYDKEKSKLEELSSRLKENWNDNDKRRQIIDQINSRYGQYMDNLLTEKMGFDSIRTSINNATDALREYYFYREKEGLRGELVSDVRKEGTKAFIKLQQANESFGALSSGFVEGVIDHFIQMGYQDSKSISDQIWQRVTNSDVPWTSPTGAYFDMRRIPGYSSFVNDNGDSARDAYNYLNDFVISRIRANKNEQLIEQNFPGEYTPKSHPVTYTDNTPSPKNHNTTTTGRDNTDELRRKEERAELKNAQDAAKTLIDDITEYYNIQLSSLNNLYKDGSVTPEEYKKVTSFLEVQKRMLLTEAERALGGLDNQFAQFIASQIGAGIDLLDNTKTSSEILGRIKASDTLALYHVFLKYSGEGAPDGINGGGETITSYRKKSTENLLEASKIGAGWRTREFQVADSYEKTGMALSNLAENLSAINILQDGVNYFFKNNKGFVDNTISDTNAYSLDNVLVTAKSLRESSPLSQMAQAFLDSGSWKYDFVPGDAKSIQDWFRMFASGGEPSVEDGEDNYTEQWSAMRNSPWAKQFKEVSQWFEYPESYLNEISALFYSLVNYEQEYYKATEKRVSKQKEELNFRYKHSSEYINNTNTSMQVEGEIKDADRRSSFGAMSSIAAMDPEIELYRLRLNMAQEYYKYLEEHHAVPMLLQEQMKTVSDAANNLNDAMVKRWKAQAEAIKKWMAPIEEYGSALGEAFADESKTVKEATGEMIKSFMKLTTEYVNQKITQWVMTKLYNNLIKASDTEVTVNNEIQNQEQVSSDATKTQAKVLLGIAGGSAETIAELGWWGIPLIAVITAVLNGLLSFAMSKVSSAFGGGSSKASTNTKLVSGMLTYDSGNVQTYAGTDGNYYSAQSVSRLSTGIVTSPIATTVNGAPALVGERGPEIVVGRETTAAIMRNDPGLLRMLVGYDKMYSGRRRTYDEGNVSALPVSGNALSDTQMADIMMKLLYRLDNPIAPNINMYGRDGLHSKMQQANQFMKGK